MNINDSVYIKSTTTRDLGYWLSQARDNRAALKVVKVDESASPFQVVAELPFADGARIRVRFAIHELEPEPTEILDIEYNLWLNFLAPQPALSEDPLHFASYVRDVEDSEDAYHFYRALHQLETAIADWQDGDK